MIFHRQLKQIKDVNVRVNERVESFNYLGIMLNETLSWKSHIIGVILSLESCQLTIRIRIEMVVKKFQRLQEY